MENKEPQACKAPLEDIKRAALEHYEELATKCHHWNSFIPQAIKAYQEPAESPSSIEGEEKRPELVKLLEWMQKNGMETTLRGKWIDFSESPSRRYTSAELVDKYLSESPSPALPIKEEEKGVKMLAEISNGLKADLERVKTIAQQWGYEKDEYLKALEEIIGVELKSKLGQEGKGSLSYLIAKGVTSKLQSTKPSPTPIDQPKDQGEVPEEYWKQVIAEIRICYLPTDTKETINQIIRQPSTIRLAKFITEKIQSLTSENTALQADLSNLQREREEYRSVLKGLKVSFELRGRFNVADGIGEILAKYPQQS
jgi:hypothetical protein